MTIAAKLLRASRAFIEATAVARSAQVAPIRSREAMRLCESAIADLVMAVEEVSPPVAVQLRQASRRAIEDAHRRLAARDADAHAHGLDEGQPAACAPEGTGALVVNVGARAADEDGLHGGKGTPERPLCACGAPAVWTVIDDVSGTPTRQAHICGRCPPPSFADFTPMWPRFTVSKEPVTLNVYPGGLAVSPAVGASIARALAASPAVTTWTGPPPLTRAALQARVTIACEHARDMRRAWLDVVAEHGQHRSAHALHVRRTRTAARKAAARAHRAMEDFIARNARCACGHPAVYRETANGRRVAYRCATCALGKPPTLGGAR